MTELNDYASLSERVAALTAADDLLITPADFPGALADHTSFGGLIIDTSYARSLGWTDEGDAPFEVVDRSLGFEAFAMPEGFRRLGLWLMHLLFSGREWAGLTLTHPTSRAETLYARIQRPAPRNFKLQSSAPITFASYEHWPQEVCRHPFAGPEMAPVHRVDEEDRPFFAFGWSLDANVCQWDVTKVDQIIIEATPEGIAALAGLLMDMADPTLGRNEVNMEPPLVGFDATQHRSIEARFWLPNSFAFYCDTLDELKLPPQHQGHT